MESTSSFLALRQRIMEAEFCDLEYFSVGKLQRVIRNPRKFYQKIAWAGKVIGEVIMVLKPDGRDATENPIEKIVFVYDADDLSPEFVAKLGQEYSAEAPDFSQSTRQFQTLEDCASFMRGLVGSTSPRQLFYQG